jgi:Na+/melibiose symporter-like transporter
MFGALNGVQGVGLNAHATTLSRLADRPFMPTMIGAASAAGVFGGAIATLAAAAGVPLLVHVGVISGFCMICLLAVSRQIPVGGGSSSLRIVRAAAARTARHTAQRIERVGTLTAIRRRPATRDDAARKRPASRTTPKRHRPAAAAGPSVDTPMRSDPTMRLLIGAGLGACLAEGGIATFSIVIFRDQIGATIAVATLSFTIFSVSMASVRLIGGSLMQSVGPRRLLVLGGLLAAGCGLVLVARPALLIALLALAGVAAGIACAVPVTLHLATERARAAARTLGANEDRATASALSRLGLATGGGYLAGGPLLGAIAGLVGLHSALLLITAGGLALAACAGVLGRLDS